MENQENLSEIEKILAGQKWKKRGKYCRSNNRNSLRNNSPKNKGCISLIHKLRNPSSNLLPPLRDNFRKPKSPLKSCIAKPQSTHNEVHLNNSRIETLKKLAVPYKALFKALDRIVQKQRSLENIRIPLFPKSPFGSHKPLVHKSPRFKEFPKEYKNSPDGHTAIKLVLMKFRKNMSKNTNQSRKSSLPDFSISKTVHSRNLSYGGELYK